MKKSTLLSFATAAAILATSAGTYAAWDKLDATTANQTVTLRNPAVVSVGTLATFSDTTKVGEQPVATSSATFTLKDMPAVATDYKFEAEVKVMDNTDNVTSDVNATVTVADDTVEDGDKTVIVTIAPEDSAVNLADKSLTVTVTGRVVKRAGV